MYTRPSKNCNERKAKIICTARYVMCRCGDVGMNGCVWVWWCRKEWMLGGRRCADVVMWERMGVYGCGGVGRNGCGEDRGVCVCVWYSALQAGCQLVKFKV